VARRFVLQEDIPAQGELRVERGTVVTAGALERARQLGVTIREYAPEELKAQAAAPNMIVALGADHGGFRMKEWLKPLIAGMGFTVDDVGVHEEKPADYPDLAHEVARRVAEGRAAWGVIVDGAGIGSAMAANKVPGVRAALCYDRATARNSREHNHANVLTLGGRQLSETQLEAVVRTWFGTPWGGGRHQARIDKITAIEQTYARRS
jgi:ribose 5-phosphate isomerase B